MWQLREADPAGVAGLARALALPEPLARVLWLRGARDPEAARRWLDPSLDHLHDSRLLPDFDAAAARIEQAVARREGILVWGHDDLDGVCAAALLRRVLAGLRGRARTYIPSRSAERHGLEARRARDECGADCRLIITVDCGVMNFQPVADLAAAGIDVIVTDHHEVPERLPAAVACVDAKRPGSVYPYRGLAGCGLALKLGMGLAGRMLGLGMREFVSADPDAVALAVLGTVADRVPLTGENRTLVATGLGLLERTRLAGLGAVVRRLRADGPLTVGRMVSRLVPLFAAAPGNEAVDRLLDTDRQRGEAWVADLEAKARQWQEEVGRAWQLALDAARPGDGLVIARDRALPLRALGFCAGRLKDFYGVPAMVLGWRGDAWVGECRTVADVDLVSILNHHARYFIDYGGHKLAAGFSIADERVEEFTRAVEQYCHEQFAGRLTAVAAPQADARLPLAELAAGYRRLAPFGDGNPAPVFVSEPVRLRPAGAGLVADCRPDLELRGDAAAALEGRQVLFYTIDEAGAVTVLDARPDA